MNALKCIKTPAVSAVRSLIASRSLSSSAIVANNIRDDLKQSANRATTWSENQIEKKNAFKGPRFENTDIDAQVKQQQEEQSANSQQPVEG
jgi:NADH dehydrogenase (ubiquinone) Fe-S protein 6